MPELPEVETVVTTLRSKLIGQKLQKIKPISPSSVILLNKFSIFVVKEILRRGKYIILKGTNELLTIHLRMTGRLLEVPVHPHFVRAQLLFENVTLNFEDMRKFGRIVFAKNLSLEQFPGLNNLGPEPLQQNFGNLLAPKLRKASVALKTFLLNQKNIAGIGNIYADEICFHAKISPFRTTSSLTKKEQQQLFESIQFILKKAIKLRGTTFAHFVDANGKKGNNFEYLQVYGRRGKLCFICNKPLLSKKLQGRTTVYCGTCQKEKSPKTKRSLYSR